MPGEDASLNKSQKMVRILELLQDKGGVKADELIGRFDLDERSLRRYLADLRELGLPVLQEGRGTERRLWIDPSYRRQGVQVSLLELVSLRFGRSMFQFLEGTGFASDLDDALETLSTLAGDGRGTDLARNLDRKLMAVPESRKDHGKHSDLIEEILSALLYQNPADAHYARVDGPTRAYELWPLTLATFRQGLYLFAHDVEAGVVKTFALDRFRHFQRRRGEHFDYPDDYHPDHLVKDAFGIIGGPLCEVILHFNRRASPYVRERIWHQSQTLHPTAGGGVRLRMKVGIAHELVSWILGFGPDVRVEAPDELRDRVLRLHREAAAESDPTARSN